MGRPTEHIGLHNDILQNEKLIGTPSWKTAAQLAVKWDTSVQYIYQCRTYLRKTGRLKPDPAKVDLITPKRLRNRRAINTYDPENPTDLLKLIADEPILDRTDRLRLLSRIVRLGAPAVKLQALKQLEDLSKQAEGRVGPPPPTTFDGQVAELTSLMLMLPFDVVRKAYENVTTPEPEAEEALQPPSDPLPGDPPFPNEPVRDLQDATGPLPAPDGGPLPLDGADSGPPLQPL